jgi:hypothetical protein
MQGANKKRFLRNEIPSKLTWALASCKNKPKRLFEYRGQDAMGV